MENYEENIRQENNKETFYLENYEEIDRADSVITRYENYRINYRRKNRLNGSVPVALIQLLIAIVLASAILLFRFVPAFEPAFNAVKDFLQKDIFENLNLSVRVVFNGI